jgi:sodium-dependent dicarboxylate transporter 2/3/5
VRERGEKVFNIDPEMFMSGIVVAIAVEHCNLHKRIALRFLLFFGTSPRR